MPVRTGVVTECVGGSAKELSHLRTAPLAGRARGGAHDRVVRDEEELAAVAPPAREVASAAGDANARRVGAQEALQIDLDRSGRIGSEGEPLSIRRRNRLAFGERAVEERLLFSRAQIEAIDVGARVGTRPREEQRRAVGVKLPGNWKPPVGGVSVSDVDDASERRTTCGSVPTAPCVTIPARS